MNEKQRKEMINNIYEKVANNSKKLNPKIQKIVNENFWDLI